MKKIFFTILILFFSIIVFSQTFGFPTVIPGNTKTQITANQGGVGTTTGFAFLGGFGDTSTINIASYIKNQQYIMTLVGDSTLAIRNSTANKWYLIKNGGGGGGGSGFVYVDSASAINIQSLGAVGDGTTDNAAAFKLARNMAKTYGVAVFIPAGTFYTSDSCLFNKVSVFGNGINSIIKFTSTIITASVVLQDSCEVYGLKFIGTGKGAIPGGTITFQNGIRVVGGYNNIHDNVFTALNGSGVCLFETSSGTIYQNRITNNKFLNCTVGIFSLLNEEYGIHSGNDIYSCTVGIWDRSGGNTRWVNNTAEYCTADGFRMTGGGNGDHNTVVGCTFNHNVTYNVNIQSTTLGVIFTGCNLEAGNIVLGSAGTATNVIISECNIYSGDIASTSVSNCIIRDCNYLGSVTHSGSGTLYVNNNNSSDAQYWRSNLNTVAGNGLSIGSLDNFDFTVKTNNVSRINILGGNSSAGEIGIGTAAAVGFKMFMVSTGNTSSTYASLIRNLNGENISSIQDDGTTQIGNSAIQTNTNNIYGGTKLLNTKLGSSSDSVYVKKTSDGTIAAVAQSSIVGVNIYNSDGTLTGDRTVTFGGNSLLFSRSGSGSFSVLDGAVGRLAVGSVATQMVAPTGNKKYSVTDASHFILSLGSGSANSSNRLVGVSSADESLGYITQGLGFNITSGVAIIDSTKFLDKLVGTNITGAMQFTSLLTAKAGINLTGSVSPLQVGGSAGTAGQVLTSAGAGATPTWATAGGGSNWSLSTGGNLTGTNQIVLGAFNLDFDNLGTQRIRSGDVGNVANGIVGTYATNGTFNLSNSDNTGKVCINCSTPSVELDVVGKSLITNGSNYLNFGDYGDDPTNGGSLLIHMVGAGDFAGIVGNINFDPENYYNVTITDGVNNNSFILSPTSFVVTNQIQFNNLSGTGNRIMTADASGLVSAGIGYLSGSATLDFGNTAAGASTDLTITVTGAVTSDVVCLGVDNASTSSNGVFTAWVSATDTVKVRFTNTNLVTAINPASGTFKVKILQ